MAQPRKLDVRPHPAVDLSTVRTIKMYGHTGPGLAVTCPHCRRVRWVPARTVRHQTAKPNFTGSCKACWNALPKARTFRSSRNPSGRGMSQSGYVVLKKNAIPDADLDLFSAMRGKGGFVFEHRWVMAKHLGRPLRSDELVDHRDGCKDHNQVDNLRLYVRGKNQPGSAPGHGTYYHEWQMALVRIAELEARLAGGA